MTYSLSQIYQIDWKLIISMITSLIWDMGFIRELGIAYSNSKVLTHKCSNYYKRND